MILGYTLKTKKPPKKDYNNRFVGETQRGSH